MQRLALIVSVIGILVGLPKLADKFRQERASGDPGKAPQGENEAKAFQPNADSAAKQSAPDTARSVVRPLAENPVPVSLASTPQPSPAVVVSAPNAEPSDRKQKEPLETRSELVSAIQKELIRLGYYEGPVTTKWTKPVRIAARKFAKKSGLRTRYVRPTEELLKSMRETGQERTQLKTESAPVPSVDSVQIAKTNSAAAQRPVNPAKLEIANGAEYLPPWMRVETASLPVPPDPPRASDIENTGLVASVEPGNHTFDTTPAITAPRAAKPKIKRQKAPRTKAASLSAPNVRQRARVPHFLRNLNVSWPGQ